MDRENSSFHISRYGARTYINFHKIGRAGGEKTANEKFLIKLKRGGKKYINVKTIIVTRKKREK